MGVILTIEGLATEWDESVRKNSEALCKNGVDNGLRNE
jgi:hypothetical protein